jgi:hypothetical protein
MDMRRKRRGTDRRGNALELLHGGETVPARLLRQRMVEIKQSLEAQFKEKGALQRDAAKYRSKLQPVPAFTGGDPQVARAVDGLRGISGRLARRKLIAPRVAREAPAILTGLLGVRVTPPYDYADAFDGIGFGSPELSALADKNSGQMSFTIVADDDAPSDGYAYAAMGIFLRPLFGPAILRAWANPAFAFSWWTNSISASAPAGSFALGGLQIIGETDSVSQHLPLWHVNESQELSFDFGSNPGYPLVVEMNVDVGQQYTLNVFCEGAVNASGWPGSLAGSNLSINVPSIVWELSLRPLVSQGLKLG